MTSNAFLALCLAHDILPGLALENPKVVAAVKANNPEEVERVLTTEF